MDKIKVGVIGCGNISSHYFKASKTFKILDIVACADLDMERARASAQMHHIPQACTVKEMLSEPEIQIIVNLTPPAAHPEVNIAVIQAGKNLYCEKPLAVTRKEGLKTLQSAKAKGVLLGCAPDTFLGGGLQTCRKIIDEGRIGVPTAAAAFSMCPGPEHAHPNPDFFYQLGGGPMFDGGPYYIAALIVLLGPVTRVTGSTKMTWSERRITTKEKSGWIIKVNIPTHYAGIMDFDNKVIANITTSFDVWSHQHPRIEIYGTEGTMSVPDPNSFGGPVKIKPAKAEEWSEIPLTHGYTENSRSIGVADMAYALLSGRPHRASGELAYHVLDIMCAFEESSKTGRHVKIKSTCSRPAPLPSGLRNGELDK